MGYGYYGGMAAGSMSLLVQLVILADLILLGIFLWKHINK